MISTLCSVLLLSQEASVTGTVTIDGKPVRDAVVWLKGQAPPKPGKATIEQKGKKFLPRVVVVSTGSTVDFPNRDDIFHNVFAEYRAKKFDLGMYPKGQTRKVVFDKPGVVSVLCNVHSEMSAFVIVVDTPYFAKTDKAGKFSIPKVPSGDYTVEAWHESDRTFKKNFQISDKNRALQLTLTK